MPTEEQILTKAEELGWETTTTPSGGRSVSREARAQAVQALLDEQTRPEPPAQGHVLSRSVVAISDGHLEITATYYPSGGTAQ